MVIRNLTRRNRQGETLPARREETHPFFSLRRQMNQLFDSFFRDFELEPFREMNEWYAKFSPQIDVKENDKEIIVTAELPGMSEKDIDVSISGGSLVVKGEKKEDKEEKDKECWHMERCYGSFYRSIPLPEEIDKEKADASFKKGILRVTIPKTEKAASSSKKIPIKTK